MKDLIICLKNFKYSLLIDNMNIDFLLFNLLSNLSIFKILKWKFSY